MKFRLIVLFALISIIPSIFIQMVIIHTYENRAVSVRTAEIQNQCTILANQLVNADYLENPISETINAEISQLSNIYTGRLVVINASFRVVKDTYGLDENKTILSEDVTKCFQGTGTTHYDGKNRYIEVTTPVQDGDGKVVGVILVSISTDTIEDTLILLRHNALMLQIATAFVLIILTMFISILLVRPLKRITRAMESITEGYEDDYLKERAYTETEELSSAFNRQLSRFKVLDQSREEFVSNVSHELKTPMTSMKVLADSLLAEPNTPVELYQEFMKDIAQQIERENVIINDLLMLVKMDKTAADVNIKSEDINELVERLLKQLRPLAAEKNVELTFESFRPVTAEVDEVKLSLALMNLVENAIKYNRDGGWVKVSLNADHQDFYVTVEDSGIGIPAQEQDKIFERFYRVDKSHSREIGGTGLGLSISREAVAMHKGTIEIYSEEGEGTTFTVRIPLSYIV